MSNPGILAQRRQGGGGPTPLPGPEQTVDFIAGSYLNQTNATNSRSLVLPGSGTMVVGDLMTATVYHAGLVTAPTGWTLYLAVPGSGAFLSVYTKTAEAGDIGANMTWTQNVSANFTVHYTVFRGAQPLSVLANATANGTTAETNLAMPETSPTRKGQYLLNVLSRLSANNAFPATLTYSAGWDVKSTTSEGSLPIRKTLAIREAVNEGDTAATLSLTPVSGSPSWRAAQLLIGYTP